MTEALVLMLRTRRSQETNQRCPCSASVKRLQAAAEDVALPLDFDFVMSPYAALVPLLLAVVLVQSVPGRKARARHKRWSESSANLKQGT